MTDLVKNVLFLFEDDQPQFSIQHLTNQIMAIVGDQDVETFQHLLKEISTELEINFTDFCSFYSFANVTESFYAVSKSGYRQSLNSTSLDIVIEKLKGRIGCTQQCLAKYVDYIESVKNALDVKMFHPAHSEMTELVKLAREDMQNNAHVMDKLLAAKMRIMFTILIQSYDEETKKYEPFFMLKDSVKKFVALEIMSCLRFILETKKSIQVSLIFKMKSFFNGELYVGDFDHGIDSILR